MNSAIQKSNARLDINRAFLSDTGLGPVTVSVSQGVQGSIDVSKRQALSTCEQVDICLYLLPPRALTGADVAFIQRLALEARCIILPPAIPLVVPVGSWLDEIGMLNESCQAFQPKLVVV